MPDALPAPLRLEIPSTLAFVRPVRKMVEGLLQSQGWCEDDVDDATLIVTEIVQNAVEHGSRGDGLEIVQIQIELDANAVAFEVRDPGTGEDPQLALDRDVEKQPSMEASRGRGLYLIYRLAGEMERSLTPGGGLCVRARKEASPPNEVETP
jgi:anti-sigma regulatory factor (Ser/Thr protein kinase)